MPSDLTDLAEEILDESETEASPPNIDALLEDLDSAEAVAAVVDGVHEADPVRAYADINADYDPEKYASALTLKIPKGSELPEIDKIDYPKPRILLTDIKVKEDRVRKEFDPVALHGLAMSMLSKGQLQPILVDKQNVLIAGERRLRAAKILFQSGHTKWETIWHNRRSVKDGIDMRLLELEENFRREDVSWQEQVLCVENIHEILNDSRVNWTIQKTAGKIGISSTTIYRDIKLAKALRVELKNADKHQLSSIRTAADAMKSLQRSRERELITELGTRLQQTQEADQVRIRKILDEMAASAVEGSQDPLDQPFQQADGPEDFADIPEDTDSAEAFWDRYGPDENAPYSWDGLNPDKETPGVQETHSASSEGIPVLLAKRSKLLADQLPYKIHLGDCIDILPTIPDASVHCIVSDPIWGIDVDDAYFHGAKHDVHFSDSATDLVPIMPEIVKQLDRILVEDAHIYIFGGSQILPFWIAAMQDTWEVAPSPLIWDKTSGYATHPERRYMASYEMCLFASKGVPTLNKPMRDIFQFKRPAVADRMVQTQKPVLLLRTFIENSTLYGQTVLDFMCGSGSTIQAAIVAGRKGIGIEIDEDTHSIALKSSAEALDLYVKPREGVGEGE